MYIARPNKHGEQWVLANCAMTPPEPVVATCVSYAPLLDVHQGKSQV